MSLETARMSRFTTGRMIAFGAFIFLLTAHPMSAQQKTEWTWKDFQGKTRRRADLDNILREHRLWQASGGGSGTRAQLSAFLDDADLSGAELFDADLSYAGLSHANLSHSNLSYARLPSAFLREADLTGADLRDADLDGSYLGEADLSKVQLRHADLARSIFEPKSLPELRGIASARNLELLTYKDNPDALVQLRKQFEDGGFREQERKITYALKRREAELAWEGCKSRKTGDKTRAIIWSSDSNLANCGSFVLNRVFFDSTCQYGMSPGRPLSLGVLLWLLCSVLYFVCIHAPGKTGLYRVNTPNPPGKLISSATC